ncbi:MAG: glycosyltransferase family 39 protein [Nanoarchaeota archaeon]|nr:glycosyltransferase family 39 protein [Nanoarchaeota archaeon]
MEIISEFKNLLNKRKFIFFVLFLFLVVQLVYSFLFPSSDFTGTGHQWLSLPELISHERSPLGSSDIPIINKFYPIFSNYTLNADGGEYILLAKNFPGYYFKNVIYLARPLYSFLIAIVAFLPRLFFDSYATIFASAIFFNFVLAYAVILLFYLLVEKIISSRTAFLSSFLFIVSPFVHSWLVQPVPELLGAFIVISSLYFLYSYTKRPSLPKLIVFSLIIGTFMLAKMFFVPTVFILILSIYFKRFKEGIIFLLIHLIPLLLWYLIVTRVFKLGYFVNEIVYFNAGIWLLNIFSWPWHQTFQIFLNILPKFVTAVIHGFLLIPVIFAIVGFNRFYVANKNILCFSFLFSFLTVFFAANFYFPRHAFLLFPLVYPLAVLGIDITADFFKKYKTWYSTIFYLIAYLLIIIISNINVYKIISY